ncbi:hypothetical protein MLD38_038133 [Melastoma candidum]|uniref:Uncharacterized protein n=1 Tax=Melastoma candidum TaxID=119954 RepID=A0ACB9KY76_9MYRT|nr:hypothetical protein MLD38_038133 [Melastoma candidum]
MKPDRVVVGGARLKRKARKSGGGDRDRDEVGDGHRDVSLTALWRVAQPRCPDWWDQFSRRISGMRKQNRRSGNSKEFGSFFRISRRTFDYICSLVKNNLSTRPSNLADFNGGCLSVNDQVAVALMRLSSGKSLQSVGDLFKLNQSSVSQITWRFVEAMEEKGLVHLNWPSDEKEMERVKEKFEKIRGLPNCCGAIDATHILMNLPMVDAANDVWFDQEKNCSMILQGVVDADMRYRDVVTGWPGKLSDASVLRSSGLYELCQNGTRLNGKKVKLSEGSEIGEYIVGDLGFPLLPWLLTPYRGKGILELEREFNKRHYATRMVAKRAFSRLKDMWKIIEGVMWMPDRNKLPRIVLVCCLLHNIVIDMEDEVQDEVPLAFDHDSCYRQQICEEADRAGSSLREKLSLYLAGKLPP